MAEGLALEAEKALSSLLCLNMDRLIRIKFIEGCVSNIAKNESVAISLRLLPKLLCLHFNRLTYDVQGNIIINKKVVKFPSELESKEIFPLEHASEHVTYRLCSFI